MKNSLKQVITTADEYHAVFKSAEPVVIQSVKLLNPDRKNRKVWLGIAKQNPSDYTIAKATIQGIVFYAKVAGTEGNNISVELIDPGTASNLSISVVDKKISITLASDGASITTTTSELYNALVNNSEVTALVELEDTNSTASTVSAQAETFLSGGVDGTISGYIFYSSSIPAHGTLEHNEPFHLRPNEVLFLKSDYPNISIILSY